MPATTFGVPEEIRDVWAANLRAARVRARVSQAELGRRAGCTRQAVSNWERGTSAPSLPMQLALSRALGRNPSRLFPVA
jgi:putative transcriptional regulator